MYYNVKTHCFSGSRQRS